MPLVLVLVAPPVPLPVPVPVPLLVVVLVLVLVPGLVAVSSSQAANETAPTNAAIAAAVPI